MTKHKAYSDKDGNSMISSARKKNRNKVERHEAKQKESLI